MSPTTKHQQLILLDHDKAATLDELSKRKGRPKQVLLRRAVDLVLAIEGATHVSAEIDRVRASLLICELRMNQVCAGKRRSVKEMFGACSEVLVRLHSVLNELGEPSRPFPKLINKGKHWITEMEESEGKNSK
jgi:predicted DNA-binding protein